MYKEYGSATTPNRSLLSTTNSLFSIENFKALGLLGLLVPEKFQGKPPKNIGNGWFMMIFDIVAIS